MKRLAGNGITREAALLAVLVMAAVVRAGGEMLEPEYTGREAAPQPVAFHRPLRGQPVPIPERITQQRADRLRFPVIPAIHGINNALTESFIKRYSAPSGLRWLEDVMKSAEPYLAFVRNEIELRGLPPEILYLPVIESGYNSAAKSKSGATGLWQFMRNSIGPYMIISDYHDERMDFWKSTHGALSKLQENYADFDDWALSLAAYNSGSGAITRLIKQTGVNDYWALAEKGHLKSESIYYVPKLIAVYYIVSNPRKFGLDISWKPSRVEWTRLPVERQADIRLLAERAGVDRDELLSMNRELYNRVTPPGGYMLKVRTTDAEAVRAALADTGISLIDYHYHSIETGDTLSDLAARYGVTVNRIMSENPGIDPDSLQLGKTLRIPALKSGGGASAPQASATQVNAGPEKETAGVWVVREGDTLWSIARLHGISAEVLAYANGMSISDTLSIGRELKLP
jgi:membrane-bound lytic murein transglycosylase D